MGDTIKIVEAKVYVQANGIIRLEGSNAIVGRLDVDVPFEEVEKQVFLEHSKHVNNPTIENNFKYHSPKPGQPEKYTAIREKAKELAYVIDELCPNSREKSIAMTELETAVMWANASVARNNEGEN